MRVDKVFAGHDCVFGLGRVLSGTLKQGDSLTTSSGVSAPDLVVGVAQAGKMLSMESIPAGNIAALGNLPEGLSPPFIMSDEALNFEIPQPTTEHNIINVTIAPREGDIESIVSGIEYMLA